RRSARSAGSARRTASSTPSPASARSSRTAPPSAPSPPRRAGRRADESAARRVTELAAIAPSLDDLASRTASARLELADVRDTLDAYRRRIDFDPSRLHSLEAPRAAPPRVRS